MTSSRGRGRLRAVAACLVAWLGLAAAARAEDPCLASLSAPPGAGGDASGVGGTGAPRMEGGVGGTGLDPGEGGIGGTGWIARSGVGGTGVVGTITAFGSICVNGAHVDYGADTPIDIDGQPGRADQLAIGQVVWVEARAARGRLQARWISVGHAVVGPVSRVDAGTGRLRVAGQSVSVPRGLGVGGRGDAGAGGLEAVGPGDFVAVSGLRRSDGSIVASRIDPAPPDRLVTVEGPATRVAPGALYLSELRVEAPVDAVERAVQGGGLVRVSGRWNAEVGALERVRVEPARRFAPDVRRLAVEGYIQDRSGPARFRLPGLDVDASDLGTGLEGAERDTRVRVVGRLREDGSLHAERIEFDRRVFDLGDDDERAGDPQAGDRDDRSDREDRQDREDREDRADRSGRSERSERSERPERPERPERSGR